MRFPTRHYLTQKKLMGFLCEMILAPGKICDAESQSPASSSNFIFIVDFRFEAISGK